MLPFGLRRLPPAFHVRSWPRTGRARGSSRRPVKLHLGKGKLKQETVDALEANNAVYAVIPPVTALLEARTLEKKVLAFPELGMEALHLIRVDRYPAIIGAAHGRSIYE